MKLNFKRKALGIALYLYTLALFILKIFFHAETFFKQIILPISAVFLVIWIILFIVWWRCPHCNKHLGLSTRDINYCPLCGKELDELYDE